MEKLRLKNQVWSCERPSPNGRFRKMAALPRGERYFVIFAAWLALETCESRHLAKPLVVGRKRATVRWTKNEKPEC